MCGPTVPTEPEEMVMQVEDAEKYPDPDDIMMCVCTDDDNVGGKVPPGNDMPSVGDPPVISCQLLLRLLDDALNMMRCLQHVTEGLMIKLDDMKYTFPFEDLYEKLRWHANCYLEWQEADTSKFLESQQAIVDSTKALCYFFLDFSRMHTVGVGISQTILPPSGRKFFLGGNWKCNGTTESINKLVMDLNAVHFEDPEDVHIVVFPPLIYIDQVLSLLTKRIDVGAQNCWTGKCGAFTGETSAEQLADMGVKWVVVGHAERRHVLGETNPTIARKASYALSQGLNVIIVVGETLDERDMDLTNDVLFEQMQPLVSKISDWSRVVLAYEPVWAIGTGKACSPSQAQEVHIVIREWIKKNTSEDIANALRIIYGASVSSSTCNDLAKQPDIDGFFVGGAAWNAQEFAAIANSVKVKKSVDFAVEQMEAIGETPDPQWQELLDLLVQFRHLALKRFTTSLFEQECIDGYRGNIESKLENATTFNIEATKKLEAERAQREADYSAYIEAELGIVRDGEQSNLAQELLEKRTEEEFQVVEDREFEIFNAKFEPTTTENTQLAEKLLDQQNMSRTWELQQRGKNGQSAEEVADLMWVYEHDTKTKTEELAEMRVENDVLGEKLNKMLLYYVRKDQEAARKEAERLMAAYAICEKKRKRWQPYYAAKRIQRYWKRFLKKKRGGVDPPKKQVTMENPSIQIPNFIVRLDDFLRRAIACSPGNAGNNPSPRQAPPSSSRDYFPHCPRRREAREERRAKKAKSDNKQPGYAG